MRSLQLLVTCEHGGNRVPPAFRHCFTGADEVLASHRGYDAGALALGQLLVSSLFAPLVASETTRLLVDLNRSEGHPALWSEFTRDLPPADKAHILNEHYHPHRRRVEAELARLVADGARVVHVAAHSFTPVLDGEIRRADAALLYDPGRPGERELARAWSAALRAHLPGWQIRRNYPYRGAADGLTTSLRKRFADEVYCGFELELNQKLVGGVAWARQQAAVVASLADTLVRGLPGQAE